MGLEVVALADVPEVPQSPDVIAGMVPDRFPASWYGLGGNLKSLLGLLAGICVVAGIPFLGRGVSQGAVVFVDWELDADVTARRARQLAHGLGLADVPDALFYVNAHGPLSRLVDDLRALVVERSIRLVVIDSLGLAICGDSQSEQSVIPAMLALRELGVAVLVLDHQARVQPGQEYAAKEAFGSVYKTNLSRSVWQLERAEPGSDPAVVDLVLRHRKSNFAPLGADLGVRVIFGAEAVFVEAIDAASSPSLVDKLPVRDRVLAAVVSEPGSTAEELADLMGLVLGTVKNGLTQLQARGRVYRVSTSRREAAKWFPAERHDRDTQRHDRDSGAERPSVTPPYRGGVTAGRDTRPVVSTVSRSRDAHGELAPGRGRRCEHCRQVGPTFRVEAYDLCAGCAAERQEAML